MEYTVVLNLFNITDQKIWKTTVASSSASSLHFKISQDQKKVFTLIIQVFFFQNKHSKRS